MMLLYPDRIVAVNTISGAAVQSLPLPEGRSAAAAPLGLVTDATTGTLYMFTGTHSLHPNRCCTFGND